MEPRQVEPDNKDSADFAALINRRIGKRDNRFIAEAPDCKLAYGEGPRVKDLFKIRPVREIDRRGAGGRAAEHIAVRFSGCECRKGFKISHHIREDFGAAVRIVFEYL